MERPALELADVVRAAADALAARAPLTADQRRALRDVGRCRTAELGGHVEACGGCGHARVAYNSCRNRHCPKCLAGQQAAWLDREARNLLPVEYHHVVFTLPAEVNPIGLLNPVGVYDALLSAAAEAAVRYLTGVKGVTDNITVKAHVSTKDVKEKIEAAFKRSAEIDARRVSVETRDGKVVLRGSVRSWAEREEAQEAAWAAPGVVAIENDLIVTP